ncbi:MAG: xanthine dehydrogenase family protein molybdopterin-binding subunit [Treponema sp.]|nr:xanthine dehydrogenase family protein molybdopterin-binding subunit [Treponema sp.]
MKDISESVVKKDHEEKMSGRALYLADMKFDGMLYGKMVRSTISFGKIKSIKLPQLPKGYFAIGAEDVPGINLLKVVTSEQPIFAGDTVRFLGEGIMMIAGPEQSVVSSLVSQVVIEYDEYKPVYDIDESKDLAAHYHFTKGIGFEEAAKKAKLIVKEEFRTGYQEQAYIEPQSAVGIWKDGKSSVIGSMQCPYYVKNAVMQTMALDENNVQVIQSTTGGGFGGKEDYPSLICCQLAVAARKTGHPVQMVLNRREDMGTTPKRHPSKIQYTAALDECNRIIGLKAVIKLDAGAYAGLSDVVLQRSLLAAVGAYDIQNLDIEGSAVLTNLVSNGAYRGFGAPQSFFAIEVLMSHLAKKCGMKTLDFKKMHFVKQGDLTLTNGKFHHHVPLPEMLAKIEEISGYSKKYDKYSKLQEGRYRKGIGMSLFYHGCGFTGAAEQQFIKAVVKIVKYEDDTVEILASNTDMGQGLKTTFSKIVSEVCEIPLENVKIVNPDTDRVPNSGPTVASRSLMIVGKLLDRASQKLKSQWISGKRIEIEEHYQHPTHMIPWDGKAFQGDAYPTYSWGINVVEVETDMMLATTKLVGVWGVFDVGKEIDRTIMIGQCQGGMLQGIGYGSIENMQSKNGRIAQSSYTDYMIPTSLDTVPFQIEFENSPYEGGPFGAKGAGELTLIGGAPAYELAVEQAVKKDMFEIPLTSEKLMTVLSA